MKSAFQRLLHAMKPCRTSIPLGIAAAKLVCASCMLEDHQWNHPLSFHLSSGLFPLLDFIVRKWPKNRNEEARKISGRNGHGAKNKRIVRSSCLDDRAKRL